jgi:hypothetical protein
MKNNKINFRVVPIIQKDFNPKIQNTNKITDDSPTHFYK